MMTALCAARNILGAAHDVWAINTEPEYHEEGSETSIPRKEPAYAQPGEVRQPAPAPVHAAASNRP